MSWYGRIKNIFNSSHVDTVKLYSYPGVMEVVPPNPHNHDKPMKCMYCHRRPCICAAKGDNRILIWREI